MLRIRTISQNHYPNRIMRNIKGRITIMSLQEEKHADLQSQPVQLKEISDKNGDIHAVIYKSGYTVNTQQKWHTMDTTAFIIELIATVKNNRKASYDLCTQKAKLNDTLSFITLVALILLAGSVCVQRDCHTKLLLRACVHGPQNYKLARRIYKNEWFFLVKYMVLKARLKCYLKLKSNFWIFALYI